MRSRRSESAKRIRTNDRRLHKKKAEAESALNQLAELHAKILSSARSILPRKDSKLARGWEGLDLGSALADGALPQMLPVLAATLREALLAQVSEEVRGKQKQFDFFEHLADFLEQYREIDVKLPSSGLRLKQLIEALHGESEKFRKEQRLASAVDSSVADIDAALRFAQELRDILRELKALREELGGEGSDVEGDEVSFADPVEKAERELSQLGTLLEGTRLVAAKYDVSEANLEEQIDHLTEDGDVARLTEAGDQELEVSIDQLRQLIKEQSTLRDTTAADAVFRERELDRLRRLEPHKYRNRLPELEEILHAATLLTEKLQKEFDGFARELSKPHTAKPGSSLQKRYFDAVGSYVAKRLGSIRHGDRFLRIQTIDFPDQSMKTPEGMVVKFSDMGTGQSQGAYLLGLLSPVDDRKIIALIDEVAMMDDETMSLIYTRLRELRERGKLLLGLVVQKAREPSTKPILSERTRL